MKYNVIRILAIFIFFGFLSLFIKPKIGFLIRSDPDPDLILAAAQAVGDKLKYALDVYHKRHGHFPVSLQGLVNSGLIEEIPRVPTTKGVFGVYGPTYEMNSSLDFYRLSYGYDVQSSFGPGDTFWRFSISDCGSNWTTSASLDSFEDLVAYRIVKLLKEHPGESNSLKFIHEVILNYDCYYLNKSRIDSWLEAGERVPFSSNLDNHNGITITYKKLNNNHTSYFFIYKDQWLLVPESLPRVGVDESDAFVKKNFPVLDKVIQSIRKGNSVEWLTLRACPRSDRDDKPIPK